MLQVFFNPNRKRSQIPPMLTSVPRESDNGIVHDVMSDSDIAIRYSGSDALSEDPAHLASVGVAPREIGDPVISPLDATESLLSYNDFDFLASSLSSPVSTPSVSTPSDSTPSDSVSSSND